MVQKEVFLRRIKNSFAIFLGCLVMAAMISLLFILEPDRARLLILILSPIILYSMLFLGSRILKGVFAFVDMINVNTSCTDVQIIGVVIEGYLGSQNKYVLGRVFTDEEFTNKSWKRYLAISDLFSFDHDVKALGLPAYYSNHTYRLVYTKLAKIIISVEDLTPERAPNPVPMPMTQYAKSILDKKKVR